MYNQTKPSLKDLAAFGPFEVGSWQYHDYRRRWLAGERPHKKKRATCGPIGKGPHYYVRLWKKKPITLVKKRDGKCHFMMGLDVTVFDDEVLICNDHHSERLTVAIEFFRTKYPRNIKDLSRTQMADIKTAKKNGATNESIAVSYQLKKVDVRKVLKNK